MIDLLEGHDGSIAVVIIVILIIVAYFIGRRHEQNIKEREPRRQLRLDRLSVDAHRQSNDAEDIRLIGERQELRRHRESLERWERDLTSREDALGAHGSDAAPSLTLVSGNLEAVADVTA